MAMAMRAAARAAFSANSQLGVRGGTNAMRSPYSNFPFNLPQTDVAKPPPAEPSTNLFVSAKVVTDRVSGFSKGFGFVKYATIEEAESGIKGMDGQETNPHQVKVSFATRRGRTNQATSGAKGCMDSSLGNLQKADVESLLDELQRVGIESQHDQVSNKFLLMQKVNIRR